jgi:hypothetical protein
VLVITALAVQVVLTAHTGVPAPTRFIRLASFFTIQSNVLVGVSAAVLALAPARDGALWRVLRLDGLIGISVTGVVYTTVLRGSQHLHGWALVTDAVFHYAVPLATVLGWLAFGPRPRCDLRTAAWSLAWPLAWLGYTLLHGWASRWYPYPFIDVTRHGYPVVLLNALVAAAVLASMAAAFWLGDAFLPGGRPVRVRRALVPVADPVVDEVQQPADDANDDRTPEGGPEAGDVERQLQLPGHPAGQPQQQAVHDQADQPEGEDVEQAAERLDDRLEHRVDDAEDQRHHDQGGDLLAVGGRAQLDTGHHPGGDGQRNRGDQHPDERTHAGIFARPRPARAVTDGDGLAAGHERPGHGTIGDGERNGGARGGSRAGGGGTAHHGYGLAGRLRRAHGRAPASPASPGRRHAAVTVAALAWRGAGRPPGRRRRGAGGRYFQRKCTNSRPKFLESFSTR